MRKRELLSFYLLPIVNYILDRKDYLMTIRYEQEVGDKMHDGRGHKR